ADVAARIQLAQRTPRAVVQRERRDEFFDHAPIDPPAARQFLERLVWFGQPVTPHESLNRLGDDLPRLLSLEILGDAPLVDLDALKPALQRLQRDDQMPERRTHRSYRRAVGEIALPSRDRQLGRQVIEQRARDSKVALAVLEVDWIDLVR